MLTNVYTRIINIIDRSNPSLRKEAGVGATTHYIPSPPHIRHHNQDLSTNTHFSMPF